MQTLEHLVEQYQTMQISAAQVVGQFEDWLQNEPTDDAAIKASLHSLLVKKIISENLFEELCQLLRSASAKTIIINKTEIIDKTVLAAEDETIIATDDATVVMSDEQTIVNSNKTELDGTVIADPHAIKYTAERSNDADQTAINTQSAATNSLTALDARSKGKTKSVKTGSIIKDRFILKEVIGSGGMSIVFKALDLRKQEAKNKNPYVAIKVLGNIFKTHLQSVLVLERESQQIQKLAHPNIVTVYDFDRDGETIYMTMECLDGVSLDQIIAKHKLGISYEETVKYVEGMCRGLAYAHSKHIIHSDFKPENVFFTKDNIVKVLDFGIARAKQIPGTVKDQDEFDAGSLGALTPPYASCEMFENKDPDARDDIYALGCVIYKLLTGSHPFDGMPANKARDKHLKPKRINQLSKKQWQTLESSLAFNREARTASVIDFLNGFLPKKRSPWVYATAAALFFTAGVAGYSWFTVSTQPELPQINLTEQQRLSISEALETAEVYIAIGNLATPPGDSALDQYEKILSIDPTNTQAIDGKKNIVSKYLELAKEHADNSDYDISINYISTGLIVEPDNAELKALENKVKNLRAK